jgi:serine protease Do
MNARLALASVAFGVAGQAFGLTPSEVFEKVSPSVWAVRALDASERPFSFGSGVVVGAGRLVTNCHILARAKSIQLKRENLMFEAKLEHADVERDLCTLTAASFTAPAVQILQMSQLKVGQRVYAIGNPEKLALTLSEGLISGLRAEDPKYPPLQTSAPISQGSSGGGLFDADGRLIGITTLMVVGQLRIAQNLNFAVPAEWIAEVPARAREQLAARNKPAAPADTTAAAATFTPAHPGLPAIGTTWRYSFADQRYGTRDQIFTIRVTAVDGWSVRESFEPGNGTSSSVAVNVKELEFLARRLEGEQVVMEVGPYFYPTDLAKSAAAHVPKAYPLSSGVWSMDSPRVSEDVAVVPAGSFKALRLDISGSNFQAAVGYPTRFEYTAWYAPEVKRYVMLRHRSWLRQGTPYADEVVKLVEYKSN